VIDPTGFEGQGPLLGQVVGQAMEKLRARRKRAKTIALKLQREPGDLVFGELQDGHCVLKWRDKFWLAEPVGEDAEELERALVGRRLV
jgi:hypothetical protein